MNAGGNKVLRSVNGPGATVCVDLFRRAGGTFGFETYRRDMEDSRGWFAIGGFGATEYPTGEAAWEAAFRNVDWLAEYVPDGVDKVE